MSAPLPRDLFAQPPADFTPTPLWWWSGEEVTRERLEWQLRQMASGKMMNVVVINLAPAGPLAGAPADDPAWFSEQWWARFTEVCEICEQLGMRVWFYDQIGFSGANVQGRLTSHDPSRAGQSLHRAVVDVDDRGVLAVPAQATALAAFALPGTDRPRRRLGLDGDRLAEPGRSGGRGQVELYFTRLTAYDYLDVDACAALIDHIHGEFERRLPHHLGGVIAGSFQDELPLTNTWTSRFAEEFRRRRGYDLLEELPALWEPTTAAAQEVLADYGLTRAELTEEAFFKPLGLWHARYGMVVGCDQMNPSRAGYPVQATQFYADYARTHRWYGAAGTDHEGDAKFSSSLAHLYGHERVWLESFYASGWGGTLEDTYDWLLPWVRRGATLYDPHAVYYGMVGGWFEWAPPSTDWRQPYWAQYPQFSDAVARLMAILSWGTFVADVGVLFPSTTVQAQLPLDAPQQHFAGDQLGEEFGALAAMQQLYLGLVGQDNWFQTKPGLLDGAGIDFEILDEASLQAGTAAAGEGGGALEVAGQRLRVIILPSCSVVEEESAHRLRELADAGARVICVGAPPVRAAGRGGDDDAVAALVDHPGVEHVSTGEQVIDLLVGTAWSVHAPIPVLTRREGGHGVTFVPAATPNAHAYPLRMTAWRWDDFDFDPARYAASTQVSVREDVARAELWNPATGSMRQAAVRQVDGASVIDVDFAGAPALLVAWWTAEALAVAGTMPELPAAQDLQAGGQPASDERVVELPGPWRGELIPTIDNRWGDLARPASAGIGAQVWTLEVAEATSLGSDDVPGDRTAWSRGEVTFGPHGLLHPAGTPVPPLTPQEAAAVIDGDLPLAVGEGWQEVIYSDSRGVPKDPSHVLGPKGRVPEEFLRFDAVMPATAATYRTVVRTGGHPERELVLGSATGLEAWWNGRSVELTGDGYLRRGRLDAEGTDAVLELRFHLAADEPVPVAQFAAPTTGAFWAVVEPSSFPDRPEWIGAAEPVAGSTTFATTFSVVGPLESADIVLGSPSALTLRIGGVVIERQEKVEYYEAEWGERPSFFQYDVRDHLVEGENHLEVVVDARSPDVVVSVDLALVPRGAGEAALVVSDGTWHTSSPGGAGAARVHRRAWPEPAGRFACTRPHPLVGAEWLTGSPDVGRSGTRTTCAPGVSDDPQWFRASLPAGTASVSLPTRGRARAWVEGAPVPVTGGVARLEPPVTDVAELVVEVTGAGLDRAGAAWTGPLELDVVPAPMRLGDWSRLGLASWSGGLAYECEVDLGPELAGHSTSPVPALLRLGELRGSVKVEVNGMSAGSVFCRPWQVPVDGLLRAGLNTVRIIVRNTLAPYLNAASPTTWLYPSQLSSGLYGPVQIVIAQGADVGP